MKAIINDVDGIAELALNAYERDEIESNEVNFFSENKSSGFEAVVSDEETSFLRETVLEHSKELIELGAEWFHESMTEKGADGLGSIGVDKYTKIVFLVAKKRVPEEWLEASPEVTLGVMTMKILIVNGIQLRRLNKVAENEARKETKPKKRKGNN